MCGWKKATANRRQAESRVKLAWICRGAKEEDEVNRRQAESRVKLAWLCRGAKEEDKVNRRTTSGRMGNQNMRDTAKYGKMV